MMKSKNLEYHLDHSLKFDQEINALLLEIYPMMPSTGTYPFTIIRVSVTERIGLAAVCYSQILVLKRTDFDHSGLMDYTIHSKEYSHIPSDSQQAFLDIYKLKHQDEAFFTMWRDQITGLGMGISAF